MRNYLRNFPHVTPRMVRSKVTPPHGFHRRNFNAPAVLNLRMSVHLVCRRKVADDGKLRLDELRQRHSQDASKAKRVGS